MPLARTGHTASLLPDGTVLVAGGFGGSYLSSTVLYDPVTGTWTSIGSLAAARANHTATLLPNGSVLVVGGFGSGILASAESNDPASGTWPSQGSLNAHRGAHSATLLPDGTVLVAGGTSDGTSSLSSSETFDPAAGIWTSRGELTASRFGHTATLLPNGTVLAAAGWAGSYLASAELYTPSNQTWAATGPLTTARYAHTATLLPNGKVLVAGGYNATGLFASAELYDPATGKWAATGSLISARYSHTATLLPNGKVLVAGGYGSTSYLSSAEVYDPGAGTWAFTGPMTLSRNGHKATLLPNGKVLVAGGFYYSNSFSGIYLSSAELYDPAFGQWTRTGDMNVASGGHTATLLPNGKVLVTGGYNPGFVPAYLNRWELFDVALGFTNAWQPKIASLTSPLNLGGSLVMTGSVFRGISEGSGGNGSQDSSSDYPLVQLRSMESEQTLFLLSAPAASWSATSFTSAPVYGMPPGFALATVFVNGIPSTGSVLNISVPVPIAPTLTGVTRLTNGAFQFAFANSQGVFFSVLASTNASLPLSNWTALGSATEVSPGQYQFTDPQATNAPCRFYRLRAS